MRTARLLVFLAVAAAAFGGAQPAAAASQCPTATFLSFDHLVYAARPLPASVQISAGQQVGEGTIDEPSSPDGCKRRREPVTVVRAGAIDPAVAVAARGRARTVFVLGERCAGHAGRSYWDCLQQPLVFQGRSYTGTAYPLLPRPRRRVAFGGPLGTADFRGRSVTVVRLAGVDPALAVGVRGRPREAFLAPSVCPYEGFANVAARNDLLRCLRSPVWFTFDPLGATVGDRVVARADRPLGRELAGATVSLARLPVVADFVPETAGRSVSIGAPRPVFEVTVPDLPAGLYEAVVSCPNCPAAGGRTLFPAGSILVSEKPKSSVGARIVTIGLGIVVIALAVASIVVWRRGRRRRASSSPAGSARS